MAFGEETWWRMSKASMITEIGFASGDIWKLLDEKNRLELSDVIKSTPHSKELVLMALGWLCREGHILIKEKEGELFVELRPRSSHG